MMAAKRVRRLPSRRTRIHGALSLRGRDYPFDIRRQTINLGSGGPVQYYYMLLTDIRGNDPTQEISNFRSCIGFWWAAMHESGLENDWEQQRHMVMATCYALINRNKSLQDVYLDALPRPDSVDPDSLSIPQETQERIRDVINRRERAGVKRELDHALATYHPSPEDIVGFAKAFQTWADNGVNAYCHSGEEGVIGWLQAVDYWLYKYRKRCPPRVRAFVNFFSYQAKVSFYVCYANFWARLIPWLQEHHGLDDLSARLLRLWHNQNQPVEIPEGKTSEGIWYPTRRGARLLYPREDGKVKINGMWIDMPRIGAEVIPDVFSGQILALHPLTWFLFSDPALCETVGLFLRTWEFDTVAQGRATQDCVLYWEMIGAILTAAHLYRIAHDEFENRRGVHETGGDVVDTVTIDDAPSPQAFMDYYISSRNLRCQCGSRYTCGTMEPATEEQKSREVPLICRDCGHRDSILVTEAEIQELLVPPEDDAG
jgi:hypothetical protein